MARMRGLICISRLSRAISQRLPHGWHRISHDWTVRQPPSQDSVQVLIDRAGQMWFAALGSYQHNPWFVHLMHKILEGSSSVLGLLQVDDMDLAASPPRAVRAVLKYYDFTTNGTERAWWREVSSSNQLYFPEIERKNPSLLQVIDQLGWRHLKGSCISRQSCSVHYLCNALSYVRASLDQNYHLVRPLSWALLLLLTSRGLLWARGIM